MKTNLPGLLLVIRLKKSTQRFQFIALLILCVWVLTVGVATYPAAYGLSTVITHHSCDCGCDEESEQCCCSAPSTGTFLQSCAATAGGLTSPLLIEGILTYNLDNCTAIPLPDDREFDEQLPCKFPQIPTTIDHPPQLALS